MPPPCAICSTAASKYKCPQCLTATCSLICCKQHRTDTGCSGQRKSGPNSFIPLSTFTTADLLQDVTFLQQGLDRPKLDVSQPSSMNYRWKKVQKACKDRQIQWKRMPGMWRQRVNRTHMDSSSNSIVWFGQLKYSTREPLHWSCSENSLLRHLIERVPNIPPEILGSLDAWILCLRDCDRPLHQPRWWLVPWDWTLGEALKGRMVLEFPTFELYPKEEPPSALVTCLAEAGISSLAQEEETLEVKQEDVLDGKEKNVKEEIKDSKVELEVELQLEAAKVNLMQLAESLIRDLQPVDVEQM